VRPGLNTILFVALLAGTLVAPGCVKPAQTSAAAPGGAPPKPPEVFVDLPTSGEITDFEDFTGRTVASKTIDVRARVTGYLNKINFKEREGQDVEAGFVLFEIDPRPYEAEVERARASAHQAKSHLKRVELDYARAKQTRAKQAISQEQFDQVQGDRNEAMASIEVAQANLDIAELNLSFTKVRASIAGRVSRTQLDPGNLVKADDTILTTIVAMDPMYAYFEVDERTMLRLRRYNEEGRLKIIGERPAPLPVKMGLADEDGYPHDGFVNFVDTRLDPATGTLQIRGIFDNGKRMLSPGMFVRVRLPIGESYRAILVSEKALGTDQGQKFVYVVDAESKAQYRRVEVGKLQDSRRVVLKGLAEGERVVVSGLQRVRPGAVVQPKMVEAATAPTQTSSEVAEAPGAPPRKSQQ
jgi:RND family efflux transporter MFP subunit